jgi:fatty acid-binding protein DegV
MGSVLKIKPILTVKDGEVFPLEKIRSRGKGIDRLCELVKACTPLSGMCVAYTTTPDDAQTLADRLKEFLPNGDIILSQVGPVVGTHSGPGVLAVALRKA